MPVPGQHKVMTRFLLLTALVVWASLAQAANPIPAAKTSAPATAAAPRVSDAEIDRTLRAKLAKSKLAANKFQIHVQGGIVTIEGKANIVQHKGIMTRMAKAAGARAVNNRIEISEAGKAKAAAKLRKAAVVTKPAS
ncbi:hypothetical protein F183_A10760 [Bryobacterales bacterium F-183]|nr:hypothetical protein F183_A10760 [Bryobacterales bacterium F-183]